MNRDKTLALLVHFFFLTRGWKNRNNSNNKQLSNLKETKWKLEKAYYIVSGNNDKNKPTSAYSVYVIVIVINYSIY